MDDKTIVLLDARSAAESLSISTRKLWQLSVGGEIPSVRIGRRRLYRRVDLERFAEECIESPHRTGGAR